MDSPPYTHTNIQTHHPQVAERHVIGGGKVFPYWLIV